MRKAAHTGFLVTLAFFAGGCGHQRQAHLVVLYRGVWRVGARGEIAPFPLGFPKGRFESLQGITDPLPSPDGQWVAFGDFGGDYDAHLLDARTLRQHRITRLGARPTISSVFVAVLLDGWSPDSRRLLLYVAPGEDTSEEGNLEIPAACYGFRYYDVASRKLTGMALPKEFQFVAWLPDDRLLGLVPGPSPCESKLVTFSVGDGRESQIGPPLVNPSQMKASADYQWALGTLGIGACKDPQNQEIAKINLRTGKATVLVPPAPWAENRWPALSPDGARLSYVRQRSVMYGNPQESLFVDGRKIYFCPGWMEYQWAGNRHITVACLKSQRPLDGDVLTLDVTTGKTLFRRGL